MLRRRFLQTSLAAGVAGALPSFHVRAADKAGRKYRTALVGCGWWGGNILREAMASGACTIVGLCDVDDRQSEATLAAVTAGTGDQPRRFRDYREMFAQVRPDIVIVATPDHWHPLVTIAAVQAGAHVYVEKPLSHTVGEGLAMLRAARATGRVVQVGTHRRLSPHNLSAREFVRAGGVGEIASVRCFVAYGGSGPARALPTQPVPKELDWDTWCGPAPLRPYNGGDPRDKNRAWAGAIHPRGFRQYLDYANGQLGDWGVHWLDQVLWITGERDPLHVYSTGGRPIQGAPILTATEQTNDAPDHQVAVFRFPHLTVHWEHRQYAGHTAEKTESVGCYFYGTKGTLHLGWKQGWTFFPANPKEPTRHEEPRLNEPDGQNIREVWADFLTAIAAGVAPACDIGKIFPASNAVLLGMLSLKLGRSVAWDAARQTIPDDPAAQALLRRAYRPGWEYPKF